MTDVSRIADSTAFKVFMPLLQNLLSAAAIGAFVYVLGALGTLQTTLNNYQTSQALLAARVDSLERTRESSDKFIDALRTSDQRQDFQLNSLAACHEKPSSETGPCNTPQSTDTPQPQASVQSQLHPRMPNCAA
jgi:hypothetical protein